MEEFITSYGLPFAPFRDLILSTHALIAGSSALALYLKQEGVDLNFKPNDMDIFVMEGKDTIIAFLQQHGYEMPPIGLPDEASYLIPDILDIVWLENKERENIQVIHVNTEMLLAHIAENFDLSCCVTWWDAVTDRFETMYPSYTRNADMFISNPVTYEEYCSDTMRNVFRIHKYFNRGFQLLLLPTYPATLIQRDNRYELFYHPQPFEGVSAFDTWQYEDLPCREFLAESSFHIVFKLKEQFYAFNRANLYTFMIAHRTYIPRVGYVYRMPHNQSISSAGLQSIIYGDYSIFELHSGSTITVDGRHPTEISLFHVYCYTVADWLKQMPTRVILTDEQYVLAHMNYIEDIGEDIGDDDDVDLPPLMDDADANVAAVANAVANADAIAIADDDEMSDDDYTEWVAAIEAEYEYRAD